MKRKLPRFVVPMVVMLIVLLLCIWMFSMAFKTWNSFTESRISYVEQVFDFTIPENAVPVRYTEKLMGQNMVIQELYITGISDTEEFIGNIHGDVVISADMNSADDDDTKAQYKSEWWYDKNERQTEFICVYESGYYYTRAYFFETEDGYDLKLIR